MRRKKNILKWLNVKQNLILLFVGVVSIVLVLNTDYSAYIISRISEKSYDFFEGRLNGWNRTVDESNYIDLQIDDDQQGKLNEYLKHDPVKKKWVKVKVKLNGEYQIAKLKFHGTDKPHYSNNKYSYTIKLETGSSFMNYARRFKLIKGEEAQNIGSINGLANSEGLISAVGEFKLLRINGVDKGHYYFVEDIKKEFLEREFGITNYSLIVNTNDWTRKHGRSHSSDFDWYPEHIEMRKEVMFPEALGQFKVLAEYINKKDVESVKSMVDPIYMAKYLALLTLFNDNHSICGDNLKLIYDFERGKFYPIYRAEHNALAIPENVSKSISNFNNVLFDSAPYESWRTAETNKLFKTLLADDEIRSNRDKYIYHYIKDKEGLIKNLNNFFIKNEGINLYKNKPSRQYSNGWEAQKDVVKEMLKYGSDYINYTHIYGSYDYISHNLSLIVDAFVPIDISYKEENILRSNVIGIQLDPSLNLKYNKQIINIESEEFNSKELVFINKITGDTVSRKHIFINLISTSANPNAPLTTEKFKKNGVSIL